MALRVAFDSEEAWDIQAVRVSPAPGRRAAASVAPVIPAEFLSPGRATIDQVFEIAPRLAVRRAAEAPTLDMTVEAGAKERALVAVRHPSGALTFHVPEISARRRDGRGAATLRFRIPVRSEEAPSARRGLVKRALTAAVIKVAGLAADAVLPVLVRAAEAAWWRQRRLTEGWHAVDASSLAAGKLALGVPASSERSLLFLHGTFSDGARAFGGLSRTTFFQRVAPLYGERIYAFNHFTLGKTPAENAADLLRSLPDRKHQFDVITHSRGGLVLRSLTELAAETTALGRRFELGHAVLVAAPNEGTPLVTPQRWEDTVGWVANLLDLFPDNPWTTAVSLVADGIVWLANRARGGIPGLGAMDAGGEVLARLQGPPGPPRGRYSALVANYRADENLWRIAIDVGVDAFFAAANDLVVPTEGGWRTGLDAGDYVPAERVGCFGLGGNLLPHDPQAVSHMNFFTRGETADFLVRALVGQSHALSPVEIARPLPTRRSGRVVAEPPKAALGIASGAMTTATREDALSAVVLAGRASLVSVFDGAPDKLHLIILPEHKRRNDAQLLAAFGSARVLEPFPLRGAAHNAGRRIHDIIGTQQRILNYINGKRGGTLPKDTELIGYGKLLFETLFPGDARRLYDHARAAARGRKLDIVFTSMIPWVADKPWEFAYDPSRKTFLATEETHFVRNVLTAVPAERPEPHDGRLKILVAVAQPVGLGMLSTEEEERVIRRGFEPLIAAEAVYVEVLARATPASLHAAVTTRTPDVVHFIGHGEFDEATQKGFLLFENESGGKHPVNDRTIREILCQRGIRLVFLNACETGRGGQADFNSGVAPALVAGGVPVVVANQFAVLDVSATSFAQHFYWSLARGLSVGEAARESRIAVNYSIAGESIDWAVPVVYARDPEAALCRRGLDAQVGPPLAARAAQRRGQRARLRVGVWDVRHAFPQLEGTLQRMNQVQDVYGFEVVALTAPIGTWRLLKSDDDSRDAVLQPKEVARRLAPQVQQIGLDALGCLTTYRMEGNFYALSFPEDKIMLFSTWDFDLPPEDLQINRMLVNLVVGGLAEIRGGVKCHMRGPRDCPFFHNPYRETEVLVGPQRFDSKCRHELRQNLKRENRLDELAALAALLAAFPALSATTAAERATAKRTKRKPVRKA